MSLKSFSFGLGLGIAFVSILFLVLLRMEIAKVRAENVSEAVEMSDDDVINRAKELGMIFYTELPSRKDVQNSSEALGTTEEVSQPTTEIIEENSDSELIHFSISRGTMAGEISNNLARRGLIDDADEFRKYLINNQYSNKILTGEYDIPKGSGYEEIVNIITGKNN